MRLLRSNDIRVCLTIEGRNALFLEAKTVPLLATPKKHSRSLNILPRKGVQRDTPAPPSPPTSALLAERSSLSAIESQIGDLAGALQLRLNAKLDGLRFASHLTEYKIKISIAPYETGRAASIGSLSNFSILSPLLGITNRPVDSKAASHEWVLDFHSESTPYLVDKLDTLIQACSNSKKWLPSSTQCVLPVEPGAALVTDVNRFDLLN